MAVGHCCKAVEELVTVNGLMKH